MGRGRVRLGEVLARRGRIVFLRRPESCALGKGHAMRLFLAAICLASLTTMAIGQTPAPPSTAKLSQQVRIDAFESHQRGDNYGIASFTISNDTDKPLNSIELTCWLNDDRGHGTTVLVWPTPDAVSAHASRRFSDVNIGLVGVDSRSACEVTKVD